jgi:hypothetical protein
MVQPRDLFTIHDVDAEVTLGLHMIGGLSGFTVCRPNLLELAAQVAYQLQ